MIEILVEEINEADVSVGAGGIALPADAVMHKKKKRKYETFKVSDDVFAKFRNGTRYVQINTFRAVIINF